MSSGKYRNQKRNEYRLLLNMHSSPLPTLVTPEELAQAEVIERELNKEVSEQEQPKFVNRQAEYQEVLRQNAQLTNEKNLLEQDLNSYKITIQAQQREIEDLKVKLQQSKDTFRKDNTTSESTELLSLRNELENKLDILSTTQIEHQRMLEAEIRHDFKQQLAGMENDCEELERQRDQIVNNPQKVEEVLEEKKYLKTRAEELQQENFVLKEENSTLEHKLSEYRASVDDITTKLAQVQRKLVDYESKIKLYEEMLEIHLLPDVELKQREKPTPASIGQPQAISRARQLEAENERLENALSAAHRQTIEAERSRLKLLQTPQPVKQLLLDILQQINAEITETTVGRSERRDRLAQTAGQLSLSNRDAGSKLLSDANQQFISEELDSLKSAQREQLLRKLLANKRVVEMTISALDIEQSLLLSGNADVLSWVKTGIVQ